MKYPILLREGLLAPTDVLATVEGQNRLAQTRCLGASHHGLRTTVTRPIGWQYEINEKMHVRCTSKGLV